MKTSQLLYHGVRSAIRIHLRHPTQSNINTTAAATSEHNAAIDADVIDQQQSGNARAARENEKEAESKGGSKALTISALPGATCSVSSDSLQGVVLY